MIEFLLQNQEATIQQMVNYADITDQAVRYNLKKLETLEIIERISKKIRDPQALYRFKNDRAKQLFEHLRQKEPQIRQKHNHHSLCPPSPPNRISRMCSIARRHTLNVVMKMKMRTRHCLPKFQISTL